MCIAFDFIPFFGRRLRSTFSCTGKSYQSSLGKSNSICPRYGAGIFSFFMGDPPNRARNPCMSLYGRTGPLKASPETIVSPKCFLQVYLFLRRGHAHIGGITKPTHQTETAATNSILGFAPSRLAFLVQSGNSPGSRPVLVFASFAPPLYNSLHAGKTIRSSTP
jgi:hypothetical protein